MSNPDHHLDAHLAPAADSIASAIIGLANRLVACGLMSVNNPGVPDYIADPLGGGEVVPVIHTRERTYWEQGTQLIEQREAKGRMVWRRLDDAGEPIEDWQDAAPPRQSAAGN